MHFPRFFGYAVLAYEGVNADLCGCDGSWEAQDCAVVLHAVSVLQGYVEEAVAAEAGFDDVWDEAFSSRNCLLTGDVNVFGQDFVFSSHEIAVFFQGTLNRLRVGFS